MQVILLERVENLGGIGDEVKVRDGFARNFLLPQQEGAPRHRREPQGFRRPPRRNRSPERRSQSRGGKGLRQGRRHVLRADPLSR